MTTLVRLARATESAPVRRRTLGVVALGAGLLIGTACGGDDDDDAGPGPAAATAAEVAADEPDGAINEEDGAEDDGADDDGDDAGDADDVVAEGDAALNGDGPGAGRAVVAIGDERFEFDVSGSCIVLFGNMSASSTVNGLEFYARLPPDETGASESDVAPAVRVNDNRESTPRWLIADPGDFPDQPEAQALSRVDSVTWDGENRVFGTAAFVDAVAYFQAPSRDATLLQQFSGTYDIDCG